MKGCNSLNKNEDINTFRGLFWHISILSRASFDDGHLCAYCSLDN